MPIITIDGKQIEVEEGTTLLEAARRLKIDIPTLCYHPKCGPLTSCMTCVVRIDGDHRLRPACGIPAQEGMVVESECPEVHAARRNALELQLSDHVGDCLAPCQRICPLNMDIPIMLRGIRDEDWASAVSSVFDAIALPAVTGRLCHRPCEGGCRRGSWDEAVSIRDLERLVAEQAGPKHRPNAGKTTSTVGKSVAIIGAGPAGLTAAYHLTHAGHQCDVFDRHDRPGGSLRETPDLPAKVLESEIRRLEEDGVRFHPKVELGIDMDLTGEHGDFDAVLLATGSVESDEIEQSGIALAQGHVRVGQDGCHVAGNLFAAGSAVRSTKKVVQAMADAKGAAVCVDQFLQGKPTARPQKPFTSVMGRLKPGEIERFAEEAGSAVRQGNGTAVTMEQAMAEAPRCLHCDCRGRADCKLRHYAGSYGANQNRFKAERRPFERRSQPGGILYEPGKCINCGICVALTEQAQEPLGLTFIGRGFDIRVEAPFGESFSEGLQTVAAECAQACPTGAIVLKEETGSGCRCDPATPCP